jgi:flavodoxin
MNAIVVYATHRSNTQKVAEAIAQAANCKAVKLTENFDYSAVSLEGIDLVFLGTGIRGGDPMWSCKTFKNGGLGCWQTVCLGYDLGWGGASNKLAYEAVKSALEARGQQLNPDYFLCLGQTFRFTHRGHPNAGDLENAKKWAQQQLMSIHGLKP